MRFVSVLICVLCISSASTAIPPTVDGFLDDPFWSTDARVWTTYRPDLPGHSARFHPGFDDDTVYFAADVNDPDVTGTSEKRLENISRDDAVQVDIPEEDEDEHRQGHQEEDDRLADLAPPSPRVVKPDAHVVPQSPRSSR